MDEESIFQEFDRLERKLDGLIQQCETLKAQNTQLTARNSSLEEELRQKSENESRLMEERTMVRTRIDSLLARVNQSVDTGEEGTMD